MMCSKAEIMIDKSELAELIQSYQIKRGAR